MASRTVSVKVESDVGELRVNTPYPLDESAVSAKSSVKKGTLSIAIPAKDLAG